MMYCSDHSSQQFLAGRHDGMCWNSAPEVKITPSLCFKLKIILWFNCVYMYLMKKSRLFNISLAPFSGSFPHAVTLLQLKCAREALISTTPLVAIDIYQLRMAGDPEKAFIPLGTQSSSYLGKVTEKVVLNFESLTWTGPAIRGFNIEAQEEFHFCFSPEEQD